MSAPTRPVMRYHGGKWRIAPWIIRQFPPHTLYVEPFAGAASVLFRKPRSGGEIINDLDGSLVNVFRVLQDPATAALLSHALRFTPYARAEFELSYELTADPVERARRTIVRAMMGHGGSGTRRHRTGFRPEKGTRGRKPSHDWAGYAPQVPLFTERLRGVCIEQMDALDLIAKYDGPDTLFYVDPPYPHSTRTSLDNGHKQHYPHELTDADHARLAEALHRERGAAAISGYDCALYDSLFQGWPATRKRAVADGGAERTEVLWSKSPGERSFPDSARAGQQLLGFAS